jgi:hypothetical protein
MTSSDILCELKEHNSRNKRNCLRELCFFGSLHRVLVSLLARNLFFTYRRHTQNLSCSFSPQAEERDFAEMIGKTDRTTFRVATSLLIPFPHRQNSPLFLPLFVLIKT